MSALPAGDYLFSRMLGWMIPYSATIGAKVVELGPGFACLILADKRRVRNHLNSVHAVALVNLGELTTGLAVFSALPDTMRGILVDLQASYVKKARGKLLARAVFEAPAMPEDDQPCEVEASIEDADGDVVCTVRATWLVGRKPAR